MTEIKHQIFVSSTFKDLIEERKTITECILGTGNIPAGMELFSGGNIPQWDIIKKWIDDSDVFFILLGDRIGTIEEKSGKSYIEKEFDYAKETNKPIFVFVLGEDYFTQRKYVRTIKKEYDEKYDENNVEEYEKFKEKLMANYAIIINDQNDFKAKIISAISENKKNWKNGWVKISDNTSKVKSPEIDTRDIKLYITNRSELRELKNLVKGIYENDSSISTSQIVKLECLIDKYKENDPQNKFINRDLENTMNQFLEKTCQFVKLINDHKIYTNNGDLFKFRPYGNKFGERVWRDITDEEEERIQNDFDRLYREVYKHYVNLTSKIEPLISSNN